MRLATAASYFSRSLVEGWDGTAWVKDVGKVSFLPFDRFISERDFGNKRRHILVKPDDTTVAGYKVIRFKDTGDVYLVGAENSDILEQPYSRIVLAHRALVLAEISSFSQVTSASGMASSVSRTLDNKYWADIERITLANSREFDSITFTQVTITLPSDAIINVDNEVYDGQHYYDIKEVYPSSGFIQCRALQKESQ